MGDFGDHCLRAIKLAIQVLVEQVGGCSALKRSTSGEQGVEYGPQAVQVAALGGDLAGRLLRRKVFRGTNDAARAGKLLGREDLGDAEIGKLDYSCWGPQ